MNSIRIFIAIIVSKTVGLLSKITGHKSSALPGQVARFIYPGILTYLWKQVQKETIIVTGTNGKTTTNNMLRDILKSGGNNVVCNDVGANMINGVTAAFIKSANIFGKLTSNYACIEVDEGSLSKVVDEIKPNKVVVTNLFRDQLDRYGEIDLTIKAIDNALDKLKDHGFELILNGDDPLTAQFSKHNVKTSFYGIENNCENKKCEESREGRFCSFCGGELIYNQYFYSQLGDYHCSNCDFKRPSLDYLVADINLKEDINFNLKYNDNCEPISLNYSGFYNIYNCLGAIAATIDIVSIDTIRSAFSNYKPQIGRMERFNVIKPIILNLSKNPAGFNQAIDTVVTDSRRKNVLVIINDNAQDGRDISWLWDCDFETLIGGNINTYFVSGIRKEDMAVRLKYAGISENNICIEEDIKQGILKLVDDNIEVAYILVNYTALFETQNILKSLQGVYGLEVKA